MSTIKHYEQRGNGEYVPVGASQIYTQEEYCEILANGREIHPSAPQTHRIVIPSI